MKRMKVLVCAYACNPALGSENAVGWNWVRAIALNHDVWVLTDRMNRDEIEAFARLNPESVDHVAFHYVTHRPWHYVHGSPLWQRLARSFFRPAVNFAYLSWQHRAYREARELTHRVRFDLVHQLTLVGFRFPGRLWRLGLPFVWGPLGGLENTPWRLFSALGADGAIYYGARNMINSAQKRWLPGPRRAMRAATGGVIAATSGVRAEILRIYGVESAVVCEVTPPSVPAGTPSQRRAAEPLRLAWSGEHLPGKALPLVLRALARLEPAVDWSLDVYGAGPKSTDWRALARRLALDHRCTWHGLVPRSLAIAGMEHAHVFIISSLKDLTSSVLLEAMGCAVPVLCPNHCGFSDVVTPDMGILLPIESPGHFVDALSKAIADLYRNEPRRQSLAAGAARRAQDFGIKAKAGAIDRIYTKALADQTQDR